MRTVVYLYVRENVCSARSGTRLNGCGTRTKGEFLSGLFIFTLEAFGCLSCLGPDVDIIYIYIYHLTPEVTHEGRRSKIQRNKTRQDNEAQMGLIRAMIENCEEQNKGLLFLVTLKVKSCF